MPPPNFKTFLIFPKILILKLLGDSPGNSYRNLSLADIKLRFTCGKWNLYENSRCGMHAKPLIDIFRLCLTSTALNDSFNYAKILLTNSEFCCIVGVRQWLQLGFSQVPAQYYGKKMVTFEAWASLDRISEEMRDHVRANVTSLFGFFFQIILQYPKLNS